MILEDLEKDFNDFRAKVKNEFGKVKKEFDALASRIEKTEKTSPPAKEEKKEDESGSGWF